MFSYYYLGRGIDAELELGSLPIVHRETLQEQGGEAINHILCHGYLGRGIDAELNLGSLPIVHGETLHEQGLIMFSHHYLGRGIDAELQLGSLPIVDRETLHEQGGEAGPRPAAERVEDQEALRHGLK